MAVAITSQMVKELRERTGAGMMDCKRALEESHGDFEVAIRLLRERGKAQVAKKSGRSASEGSIVSYIHGGRIGVLLEVNSETDFVARNPEFQTFAREVAMHIAAASPRYVTRDEVPEAEIAAERAILRTQAEGTGKPAAVIEKIVEGRLDKFYERVCLLDQPWVREPERTIGELLVEIAAKVGEHLVVRRFVRWELGEALDDEGEGETPA